MTELSSKRGSTTVNTAVYSKIAAQAEQAGASSYKITQAYSGNRVHMTAELNK